MKYILLILLCSCSWQTNKNIEKIGKHERITMFALLPIPCSDGNSYWFQTVKVDRTWDETIFGDVVEENNCIGKNND